MKIKCKTKYYVQFDDGTIFSNIEEIDPLVHILICGSKESIFRDRLIIASSLNAYEALTMKTQKKRNEICKLLKGGRGGLKKAIQKLEAKS